MKFLVLSLGKILFQISVLIFIVGYCFGFWFKEKKQKQQKQQKPHEKILAPLTEGATNPQLDTNVKAA